MTAESPDQQRLFETLKRRARLRKIALWVIVLLLILPVGAAIWLIAGGKQDAVPASEASVAEVRERVFKVHALVSDQSKALEMGRAAQEKTQQSLTEAQNKVAKLESLTTVQNQAVGSQKAMLEEIRQQDNVLQSKLSDVANGYQRSSDNLKASIADLNSSLGSIRNNHAALANDITTIRASLDPLRDTQRKLLGDLQTVESSAASMNVAISAIDRRLSKLEAAVAEMRKASSLSRGGKSGPAPER